jgi:nitrate/nitrite transport system ATP-binding protein
MAFVELRGVTKSYGTADGRIEVLGGIDLSIERGEFVAIVGCSGAGKTTLMSLIAGLSKPDCGTIRLDGEPVVKPGRERGVVFQNYSLLPWLTVLQNVQLAVEQAHPEWSRFEQREAARANVAKVNLLAALNKRPAQLSGGMRQRVSVARALAMDPELLLLDEPLSALDALTRATLQDEFGRICSETGKTVLLITNDVDEGILLADRIIALSAGPGATLGPSVSVQIARPRDRKALNHDPDFARVRAEVFHNLRACGRMKHSTKKHGSAAAPLRFDAAMEV